MSARPTAPAPRTRRTRLFAALAISASGLVSCGPTLFEQQLRSGRLVDAAVTFAGDSTLQRTPQALRAAARLHLVPGDSVWDPARALILLQRARALDGDRVRDDDARLERLLDALEVRHATLSNALERLGDSTALLRDRLAMAREERDELVAQDSALREERDLLQRLVARLERDLRDREGQLVLLRLELERLKAIDFSPTRPPRPARER